MATNDDHLRDQGELAVWILNFWSNTKKVSEDNMTADYLTSRKAKLDEYWNSFMMRHRVIMYDQKGRTSSYATTKVFDETEPVFFVNMGRIQDRLTALEPRKVETSVQPNAQSVVVPSSAKSANLERLKLPNFDGDWLNRPTLNGLFEFMVHSDKDIPRLLKLQHLKLHLSGEAAALIENTPVSEEGYDGAWNDLLKVYENDHLLLFKYMRSLVQCAPASKSSASELKCITSTVNRAKRAFAALKRPTNQWSDWFLFMTVEKLDSATKLYWQSSLDNSKEIPTFDSLLTFLDTRIQALTVTYADPTDPAKEVSHTSSKSKGTGKRTTVHHSATSSTSKNKYTCPLCQKEHTLGYCFKFKALSASERLTQAMALKVCQNCLNVNPSANRCRSAPMCQVGDCRQKHHTLMHPNNTKGTLQDTQRLPEQLTTAPIVTMTTTTACRAVLLATARIRLESSTGESVVVRALLDHAAKSSFISEWAAETLRVTRQRVSIPTSGLQGTATGEVKAQTRVIFRSSRETTFSMHVSALILPSLSNLLPPERVQRQYWPHLEGLQLADLDFIEPGRIDAILGADVYGSIVRGSVRHRSPDEPTAMDTVFRWVVFGPTGSAQQNQRAIPVLH